MKETRMKEWTKAEWLNWQRKVIREERQELEMEKKRK